MRRNILTISVLLLLVTGPANTVEKDTTNSQSLSEIESKIQELRKIIEDAENQIKILEQKAEELRLSTSSSKELLEKLEKIVIFKYDEIEDYTVIYHKNESDPIRRAIRYMYNNESDFAEQITVLLSFGCKSKNYGKPNLYIAVDYYTRKWMFFDTVYFTHNGKTKRFNVETDMEIEDEYLEEDVFLRLKAEDIKFLEQWVNAKTPKIRITGRKGMSTQTIPPEDIKMIKEMLTAYSIMKQLATKE